MSLNAKEQKLPIDRRKPLCYKNFDVLVILSVPLGFEAPSMKLCNEISLLSLPVSRRERLLSLGPILCRGFANGPEKQHGSKNLILGFFVATIKVSVKAFEGLEQENAYISATRPSIKILSTLFTIQPLILVSGTPKISKK